MQSHGILGAVARCESVFGGSRFVAARAVGSESERRRDAATIRARRNASRQVGSIAAFNRSAGDASRAPVAGAVRLSSYGGSSDVVVCDRGNSRGRSINGAGGQQGRNSLSGPAAENLRVSSGRTNERRSNGHADTRRLVSNAVGRITVDYHA